MGNLRIGIAGLNRGRHFYEDFTKVDGADVIAVMDPNQEVLQAFCSKYKAVKALTDYQDLLDSDIDAVVIASPIQLHVEQAVAALERNIHVLSEVTAATKLYDCMILLEAARKSKAQYMMAENYCYIRENIAVRNMVKAGLFGELYYAEGEYLHNVVDLYSTAAGEPTWRLEEIASKRGAIYGTHSLGPIINWFDSRVISVNCLGSGSHTVPAYKNDDSTIMLCRTESGGLINIRLDTISNRPHNMGYYTLQGTKGCYEAPRVPGGEHRVWLKDYAASSEEWLPLANFYKAFLPKELIDFPEAAKTSHHWGADYFMVKDFVRCIREGRPVPIDIYRSLEFTLPGIMSQASIAHGGVPVTVPDVHKW
ncbi:Gfo/Idh/MocA family protein [Gracilibacillus alcaliphilus]|uniref:Gfo/Idh/MocA family protein n=1 Tax=Gracilibacillus alcaliphilus TaxID=1401441 RepID=UPI0019564D2E|nr:Gfo/Idh/MocA family oxidoreductase [Gracilibacillus alcaliphilus]MBM7679023.1 putative dehydrogenase [Gracilibacillus alcaliphilus]